MAIWEDRQIKVGDDRYTKITDAITASSIAIFLISSDFLTSDFILGEEVPRLLELRAREGLLIIPVIVRPCAWQNVPWLASIQCYPAEGRALSGESDYQIENDLAQLVSYIASLLKK